MKKIIGIGIVLCLLMLTIQGVCAEPVTFEKPKSSLVLLGDPDGPLEGGLDDPSDWTYLLDAGFFICIIVKGLKDKTLFNSGSLRVFIGVLSAYGLFTFDTGLYLGEAFDLIEMDDDGC